MNTVKEEQKEIVILPLNEVINLASLSKILVFAECVQLDSYHMALNY